MPDFTMFPKLTDTRRLRAVLPALLCLAGLFLPGCSKREPVAREKILRLSQRNEPATLDPQLATLPDEFFIIRALSEGLVTPNPAGGAPLPAAAERWESSPDGLVWTFHLRKDARWSNGDPVRAQDFIYSFRRALTPALAAPKAQMFFAVKSAAAFYRGEITDFAQVGFAAPDDRTLVITLGQPAADLPALAASGPWIPVHPGTVEKLGRDWTRPGNFVGNGPFTLADWTPNRHITVQKNPAYGDAGSVRLAGIRFLAFDNGDAEERAFRAGQLDVTMSAPAAKLDSHRSVQPPVLRTVPLHETRYLALNTMRPPLDNPRVRRALALALDRPALVEKVLNGGQQPALSFVPPGLGGYTPSARLVGSPDEARSLLADAGYPDGRGFPRLELTGWAGSPVLEAVQQMWKQELGIEVSIVQREAKTHLAALAAGDYDIGFVPAIPDYDDPGAVLDDLLAGAAGNYPHWQSPDYDRRIAAAQSVADPARRLARYQEAERVILADLPLIPLYFNSQNFLVRPAVKGWQADALWTRYYKQVQLHEN